MRDLNDKWLILFNSLLVLLRYSSNAVTSFLHLPSEEMRPNNTDSSLWLAISLCWISHLAALCMSMHFLICFLHICCHIVVIYCSSLVVPYFCCCASTSFSVPSNSWFVCFSVFACKHLLAYLYTPLFLHVSICICLCAPQHSLFSDVLSVHVLDTEKWCDCVCVCAEKGSGLSWFQVHVPWLSAHLGWFTHTHTHN